MINKICKILFLGITFGFLGLLTSSGCLIIWECYSLHLIPSFFGFGLFIFCPIGIVFSFWGLIVRLKYNKGQLFYPIALLLLSILFLISQYFSYA